MRRIRAALAKKEKDRLAEGAKQQRGLIRSRDAEVQMLSEQLQKVMDESEAFRDQTRLAEEKHADVLAEL